METFLSVITIIGLCVLSYAIERFKAWASGMSYVHSYRRSNGTNVRKHTRRKPSTWGLQQLNNLL